MLIFARPRYNYDSYVDFYHLITLSGFPLIYLDEIDAHSNNTYIMTLVNGENQVGWSKATARIILWDIEWRLQGDYPRIPGVTELWASDAWYAQHIGAKYVPMGSHPRLNPTGETMDEKKWDYVGLMYMIHRRQYVRDHAAALGVNFAPDGWGHQRHQSLLSSHAMYHVHQNEDVFTIAPLRWALAAAYRLPVVAECVHDQGILRHISSLYCTWENMPAFLQKWAKDSRLKEYGEALYQCLCVEHPFRFCVEGAL